MADVVKQVTIAKEDLPASHIDGNYVIRFRAVSQDGLKSSAWSAPQMISIPVNTLDSTITGSIIADSIGVNIGWKADNLNVKPSFDIYLSWTYPDGQSLPYVYAGTVQSNTYYASISSDSTHGGKATNVSVIVQKETALKQVGTASQLTNPVLVFSGNNSTVPVALGLPTFFDAGVIT